MFSQLCFIFSERTNRNITGEAYQRKNMQVMVIMTSSSLFFFIEKQRKGYKLYLKVIQAGYELICKQLSICFDFL